MNAVIPVKRISVVDATESMPTVKPAEAVERDPVTADVETSETAEVGTTKSVESTEVAPSEMTTPEVTTAEMATAGIRDLGQRDHARDKHRGHERYKLHDTLLLDGDLLVATEVL
jgi:hypothetical protein